MKPSATKKKFDALVIDKRAEQIAALPEIDQKLLELSSDGRVALLRRENKRLREKVRQQESGWEIVKQAFDQAYQDNPLEVFVNKPPIRPKRKTTEEAVLHITDLQIGKETATYTSVVAAERVMQACKAAAEIVELRRNFANIDTMRIELGGDMVEGEGEIFPTQAHEIDQDLIDQMIKQGPECVASGILYLLQVVKHLFVDGVPGNHGRMGRRAAKRNNADSIFYEVVRKIVQVAAPKESKRITWNLPLDRRGGDEWFASFKICDKWGGLLVHGDQIRGQLGFPWYNYGKKVGGWASLLPAFDYLWAGHWHTDAAFDLNNRRVFSTGSTESSNHYAEEQLAAGGHAKQRICFFNEKWGLLADHPIHLQERKPQR